MTDERPLVYNKCGLSVALSAAIEHINTEATKNNDLAISPELRKTLLAECDDALLHFFDSKEATKVNTTIRGTVQSYNRISEMWRFDLRDVNIETEMGFRHVDQLRLTSLESNFIASGFKQRNENRRKNAVTTGTSKKKTNKKKTNRKRTRESRQNNINENSKRKRSKKKKSTRNSTSKSKRSKSKSSTKSSTSSSKSKKKKKRKE